MPQILKDNSIQEILGRVERLSYVKPTRIVLVMIAKNEAHCIARCFDSCRGLIDGIVLVDTGSTDNTIEVAKSWAIEKGISIHIDEFAWTGDFSEARNAALKVVDDAKEAWGGAPDWLLLLDADEEINGNFAEIREALRRTPDAAIAVPLMVGNHLIPRVNLIRYGQPWEYKYRLHETLQMKGGPFRFSLLANPKDPEKGPHVKTRQDGARTQNPNKLMDDVTILDAEYAATGDPHYLYYAGRVRTGMKDFHGAETDFEKYLIATEKNEDQTIPVKRHYAYLMLARLSALLEDNPEDVEKRYLDAFKADPSRAEPLGELATYWAEKGEWARAKVFAAGACHVAPGSNFNCIDPSWHSWRSLDILVRCYDALGEKEAGDIYRKQLQAVKPNES